MLQMEFLGISGRPESFQVRFARKPDVGLEFRFVPYKGRWAFQSKIRREFDGEWKQAQNSRMVDSPVAMFVLTHNARVVYRQAMVALEKLR
jgi:hypothetical protein